MASLAGLGQSAADKLAALPRHLLSYVNSAESSSDQPKEYISLPTLDSRELDDEIAALEAGTTAGGGTTTRILRGKGRLRSQLGLLIGGAALALVVIGAIRHTWLGSSNLGMLDDDTERPAWWGLSEQMGWKENETSTDLGPLAESRYRLGFSQGQQGAKWYVDHLESFAASLPAPIARSLLANLRSHFVSSSNSINLDLSSGELDSEAGFDPDTTSDESQSYAMPGPMVEYKNIFQTDKTVAQEAIDRWTKMNKKAGWGVEFYDDFRAQEWMEQHFAGSDVEWAYNFMKRGVLKADFLRYMLPLVDGGVYVDVDTIPVRPIEEWGTRNVEYLDLSGTDGPDWRSNLASRPSVVVGVDVDVHKHPTWFDGWPRPLGICQWALSSAPHHPIMLDAVRRVVNSTHVVADWEQWRDSEVARLREEGEDDRADEVAGWTDTRAMEVMEWTGPGLFSDAVTAFLLARYDVTWHRLRNLDHPLRIGDVMILPIVSFSPGGEADFGSKSTKDIQSALIHDFRGSWKGDGWR